MSIQLPAGYWIHEQEKKLMEQLDREWQAQFNARLWLSQEELDGMTADMRKQIGIGLLAQMSEAAPYKHDPAKVLDVIEKLNNK